MVNMKFIEGRQVLINQESLADSIRDILKSKIDWDYENGVWCTITDVCNAVGITPTHKNLVQAGAAIREIMPSILTRRSNSKKLILIPCRIIDEPTSGS